MHADYPTLVGPGQEVSGSVGRVAAALQLIDLAAIVKEWEREPLWYRIAITEPGGRTMTPPSGWTLTTGKPTPSATTALGAQ
jgi:hypothetical protein